MTRGPRTFVSWSHADYRAGGPAFCFIERLRRQELDVWWYLNRWDQPIPLGVNLAAGLSGEFARATVFIGMITEHTVVREWTARETEWALARLGIDPEFRPIFLVFGDRRQLCAQVGPTLHEVYRKLLLNDWNTYAPRISAVVPDNQADGDRSIEHAVIEVCDSAGVEYRPLFDADDPSIPVLKRTYHEIVQLRGGGREQATARLMDDLFQLGRDFGAAYDTRDYVRANDIITAVCVQYERTLGRRPYYLNIVRAVLQLERGLRTQRAAEAALELLDELEEHALRDHLWSSLRGQVALLSGEIDWARQWFLDAARRYEQTEKQPAIDDLFNLLICDLISDRRMTQAELEFHAEQISEACGNSPSDFERFRTMYLCLAALQGDERRVERQLCDEPLLCGDLLFATFRYLQRMNAVDDACVRSLMRLTSRYLEQGGDPSPVIASTTFDTSLYVAGFRGHRDDAIASASELSQALARELAADLELRHGNIEAAERHFSALFQQYPNSLGYFAKTLQCLALRRPLRGRILAWRRATWALTMPESLIHPPMHPAMSAYCRGFVCWLAGRQGEATSLLAHAMAVGQGLTLLPFEEMMERK